MKKFEDENYDYEDKIDSTEIFDDNAEDITDEKLRLDDTTGVVKKPIVLPFYFGIAALALGALFFGLSFVPAIGLFGLCASIVLEIAAISLFKTQKVRNKLKGTDALYILSYVLLVTFAAFFIGGIVYSAMK